MNPCMLDRQNDNIIKRRSAPFLGLDFIHKPSIRVSRYPTVFAPYTERQSERHRSKHQSKIRPVVSSVLRATLLA
jgi:hypothetical protein